MIPPIEPPQPRPPVLWRDKPVRVQARFVPRFLWTTASIDVFCGDQCILRTGGQLKLTGSHSAQFNDGVSEHRAELNWGHARKHYFPYQLRIDGAVVDESQVKLENWRMGFIAAAVIGTTIGVLVFWFIRLVVGLLAASLSAGTN